MDPGRIVREVVLQILPWKETVRGPPLSTGEVPRDREQVSPVGIVDDQSVARPEDTRDLPK